MQRRDRPALAVNRHHIGMAGEHYPWPRRPQAGVKIGFCRRHRRTAGIHAKTAQKAVYVIDHLEIGFATGGIKASSVASIDCSSLFIARYSVTGASRGSSARVI